MASDSGGPGYLVFGAYGGIGSALVRGLVASGERVVVSGRDPERLEAFARAEGVHPLPADATDFQAVESVVGEAGRHLGGLAGVASCVGSVVLRPAHLTRQDDWEEVVATNLTSAFAVVRAAAGAMMRDGGGSIVLVSTAAARIGLPNHEAIAAAKGGVDALVRSAAATYGRQGVRVNAVAPGLVDTPLTARITGSEKARASSEAMHALGRIGSPEQVAEAIRWLLSDAADWVTGQTLGVDGGLGTVRAG
jgi:3-oxoacyl-[acyl-carrier protein] reductase